MQMNPTNQNKCPKLGDLGSPVATVQALLHKKRLQQSPPWGAALGRQF